MAVFYTYSNTVTEKKDFLDVLYHDQDHGEHHGRIIYLRKSTDGVMTQKITDMTEDVLAETGTDSASYYTSVNLFRGSKRTSDCVFSITSIFIDLDCHADDPKQVEIAKEHAVKLLELAFESGVLSIPTMITDTGRGFGLQYVLASSIAAQTEKTAKSRTFFQKVRRGIFEKFKEVLSSDPLAAQPDAAVLDEARVCRLPGTFNAKSGTYCRLISVSNRYYELHELVQGCHLWEWKPNDQYKKEKETREKEKREHRKQLASKEIVSFSAIRMPFLANRVDQLRKLQDIRGKNCTNCCREQILFIAYSALVQLDRTTAVDQLQELNRGFSDPLPQKELENLIRGTNRNETADHKGYYLLKNSYLKEKLELTDAEIKAIGLNTSCKRAADRQAARDKKEKKRKKVIELLKQVDRLTYEEIAAATHVSRRAICRIAKAGGLMRYNKAAKRSVTDTKLG